MYTENRVLGESEALESVRRYRQDTRQVLNVSSRTRRYCFAASFQRRRNLIFRVSSRERTRVVVSGPGELRRISLLFLEMPFARRRNIDTLNTIAVLQGLARASR